MRRWSSPIPNAEVSVQHSLEATHYQLRTLWGYSKTLEQIREIEEAFAGHCFRNKNKPVSRPIQGSQSMEEGSQVDQPLHM